MHFSPSHRLVLELTTKSRNWLVQSAQKWSNFKCAVLFQPDCEIILIGAKLSEESGMTPEALLIEDGSDDRLEVKLQLEVMGFKVFDVASAEEARETFAIRNYSLVVIHLGHSPLESLEICRKFRSESTVPIIMLTARDEVVDEELALGAGADDYVTKPIDQRIFVSRVTQQMKRGESQRIPRKTILTWESLTLDLADHRFTIGDTEILLTNSEFRFLQLLMENPERVFP
ncbi:MAG: DNA-binding response regulator, partial [Actinobacteria bacterium]|nr:DNA-binding response regulator [Actinomycetota bacterium]